MAQVQLVSLVDDLDGQMPADETVTFGLDGAVFEIDLAAENAARLRESLQEFVESARRTGGRIKRGLGSGPKPTTVAGAGKATSAKKYSRKTIPAKLDAKTVREWAIEQGYDISGRGRIPEHIVDAYKAAKKIS